MSSSVLSVLPDIVAADLPHERWDDRVLTFLGSTLDGAMLRAMRLVVDAIMVPRPDELPALRASAAPFVSGELWDEPRRFFSFVDEPVAYVTATEQYLRSLHRGVVHARQMRTAYRPYHAAPALPAAESGKSKVESGWQAAWRGLTTFGTGSSQKDAPESPRDDPVLIEHWRHEPGRPLGTVVALHGFSMGYPRLDGFALFAAQCFREGLDVALVTLPFHGLRTPPDARFSGERFAVPHVARLNEAVRQAIYEIHVITGWLRQQTGAPVGLLGLSLGGYLAALMAGLRADLDFVIAMVPPVCMGDLAWRFFSHSRHYRGTTPAFSREELRAAYRVHSPLSYPRRVDKARTLIIAGRGDQIVPPEHPHALWRHWETPEIYWFSGSHLAPFRRGRLAAAIIEHLRRCTRDGR